MSPLSWGLAQGFGRSMAHADERLNRAGRKGDPDRGGYSRAGLGGGAGTDCQDLVRARPVKREFGVKYLGVGVRLCTPADGRGRIVHPCPTTHSEVRC